MESFIERVVDKLYAVITERLRGIDDLVVEEIVEKLCERLRRWVKARLERAEEMYEEKLERQYPHYDPYSYW